MWKSLAGQNISQQQKQQQQQQQKQNNEDDEWETDADFVNTVSEKEQRWGSKSVQGSGRCESINVEKLTDKVKVDEETLKKQQYEEGTFKPSMGYGGKFGVQTDRVDKSAVDFNYQATNEKHSSQTDYSNGFGGKFGIATDRKDRSAHGFEHVENVAKHSSQTDYSRGFGGKFGVEKDSKDKSAVGFEHVESVPKHSSQVDHSKGFGGKFGVASDRKDKSAVGFEHVESVSKHSSQTDYSKGFGGKFGVETDKMDKSAVGFTGDGEQVGAVGTNYQRTRADSKGDIKSLKQRFENQTNQQDESAKRAFELRKERLNKENLEKEEEKKAILQRVNNSNAKTNGGTAASSNSIVTLPLPEQVITIVQSEQPVSRPVQQQQESVDEYVQEQLSVSQPSTVSIVQYYDNNIERNDDEWEQEENSEPQIQSTQSTTSSSRSAIALYDYTASEQDELTFDPNDIITNIQELDEGWWQGTCNGKFGLFPANYVQLIE